MSRAGSQVGEGDAFERLNRASVALLDPLFEDHDAAAPAQLVARLGQAITRCAQEADALGVRSVNYLATLLLPHLQREAEGGAWPAARERVEAWIAQLIAFCAGHASPQEAVELVFDLQRWPGLPAVPAQFVDMIANRLREDAGRISAMAEEANARLETPVTSSAQVDPAGPGADAGADGSSLAPATVALDELAMLAEAVDALSSEVIVPLASIRLPPAGPEVAAVADLADLCEQRLGNLAAAMGYVGLAPAAQLLEPCREGLRRWRDAPQTCADEAVGLLGNLTSALAAFFATPAAPALERLQAVCADPRWPGGSALPGRADLGMLGALTIVGSRQVAAHGALDEEDLSLALPEDADPSVLDNLLRELPTLSAEFALQIEQLVALSPAAPMHGEPVQDGSSVHDALAGARRVAHTLKGAANTVGIRGIATLTHRLEDLLQLLGDRRETPDASVRAMLAEASDCLGEMTDAVAGLGPAPEDALGLCRRLGELIERRIAGPATDTGAGNVPDAPGEDPAPAQASPAAAPVLPEAPVPGAAGVDGELLRVPSVLLDRVLDLASEAAILLAQVQEQVAQLAELRHAFRGDSERLRGLAGELERLVDLRGVSLAGRRGRGDFDPLELDDYDELHTVSRRIGEAAADARLMDQQIERQGADLGEAVGRLERMQTDLREAVMQSRMVPVRGIVPRLQRVVRQAARMANKSAQLEISGQETEVDARLLQSLVEPIGQLLRNAIAHGIEAPQERERSGKPATGRVSLGFRRDGRRLRISCSDDGQGLDLDAIRQRAEQQGLLAPGAPAEPSALAALVMEPGFTTRDDATQLSGRGFGLEVVRRVVRELRGEIALSRSPAGGLLVELDLPEGMVAIPVVVVRTRSHVLALSIRGIERILPATGAVRDDAGALRFVGQEGLLPASGLDELIGLPQGFFAREAQAARLSGSRRAEVMREAGTEEVALLVRGADGALHAVLAPAPGQTRSVVVRPLPSWLPAIPAVEGATVLGDGAVATVLDLPALLGAGHSLAPSRWSEHPAVQLPLCLVVDDSVSVRRSMELFLRDLGLEVESAGDGVDALELAQRRPPALAIVDLEMPRMNGVELCRALRADEATRRVPVIMITSRSSERHRRLALEAGVDVFLTKPYSEDELAAEVRRCLVEHPAKG